MTLYKYIVALAILLSPATAFAAIAFDAASNTENNSSSPATWTHVVTGANTVLLVGGRSLNGNIVSGCTYNGVAMTQIGTPVNLGGTDWDYVFYLIAPATGSNTVSCAKSAGSVFFRGVSYTGVSQSGFPDAASANTGSGTTITCNVTTVADNAWLVGYFDNESGALSAGANTTIRTGGSQTLVFGDSNAAKTPPGTYALNVSYTGSDVNMYSCVSLAPVGAANPIVKFWNIILFGFGF